MERPSSVIINQNPEPMKRKVSFNLVAGVLIFALAGMFFTACEEDDGPEPKAEITSFAIADAGADGQQRVEGTIESNSITVNVPFKTDVTALTVEIEVSEGASVTPASGQTLDFTDSRNFVVTNGDLENTYEVTVNKMDPEEPVLMSLDVLSVTTEEAYEAEIDQANSTITVTYNELQSNIVALQNVEIGPEGASYVTSSENDTLDLSGEASLTVEYGENSQQYTFEANVTEAGFNPETVETLMDKSGASQSVPTAIETQDNRGADFNGDYVFVASRQDGNHVYYWEVGASVDEMKELQGMDQISGGDFPVSDVETVGDAIYVSNMAMSAGNLFKVYKWDNVDDAEPEVVLEYEVGETERLGDAISVVGDPAQDGFIASANFPGWGGGASGENKFYVWKASSGSLAAQPETWEVHPESGSNLGQYGKINEIPGMTDMYLVSGTEMGVAVINGNGEAQYEIPTNLITMRVLDPQIFEYNDGVYLTYTINRKDAQSNTPSAHYEILNITEGADALEGLKNLSVSNLENKRVYEKDYSNDQKVLTINADTEVEFDENGDPVIMSFNVSDGFIVERFTE